jgi:hypothetical protein
MNAFEKYSTIGENDIDKNGMPWRKNYYEASTQLMDQQLRVELKNFMKPTTDAELLEAYCIFHEVDKGVEFEGADL